MFTSLKINNSVKNIKTNYFQIKIEFSMGSSRYCNVSVETNKETEVLSIANELDNLKKWFTKDSLDHLIENSILKDYILEDIFEIQDENTDIKFEGQFSVLWIDDFGNECSVKLLS